MKIAGVQMDVRIGEVDQNLDAIIGYLQETAGNGAALTVFPECAISGYCFESLDEARPFAQSVPGPATKRIGQTCAELNCHAIVGMLESVGNDIFNAAVLIGPDGVVGTYRKVHLPFLGIDMHTTFGDCGFEVFEAGDLKVGMTICYDASFPEASRSLAIQGADLIALPTNWPPGSEATAEYVINARSIENGVYFIAVNRVGTERGFEFIGMSRISAPNGETLAFANGTDEEILYAEIDPEKARRKRIVRVPDKHVIDRMADRRPETYAVLTEPHGLKPPGRD